MSRGDLSEAELRVRRELLPLEPGRRGPGRPPTNNREVINGILWRLRAGAPWRDLPERYGNWNSVYRRFRRWSASGVWKAVSTGLADVMGDAAHHSIDSTTVRAHVSAAGAKKGGGGQALGRSRGGWTSKLHCVADARGRPLAFHLTGGEAADSRSCGMLIALLERRPKALLADKGYDADAIRADLAGRRVKAVIPGRSNRTVHVQYDRELYKQRNRIGRMIGHLKINRALAARYDKLAESFLSMAQIAAIRLRFQYVHVAKDALLTLANANFNSEPTSLCCRPSDEERSIQTIATSFAGDPKSVIGGACGATLNRTFVQVRFPPLEEVRAPFASA